MALGPGKYDDLATLIRERTKAEGVVVIVVDGDKGSGVSAQLSPELTLLLPTVLRNMANDLEEGWPSA